MKEKFDFDQDLAPVSGLTMNRFKSSKEFDHYGNIYASTSSKPVIESDPSHSSQSQQQQQSEDQNYRTQTSSTSSRINLLDSTSILDVDSISTIASSNALDEAINIATISKDFRMIELNDNESELISKEPDRSHCFKPIFIKNPFETRLNSKFYHKSVQNESQLPHQSLSHSIDRRVSNENLYDSIDKTSRSKHFDSDSITSAGLSE